MEKEKEPLQDTSFELITVVAKISSPKDPVNKSLEYLKEDL